MSAVSSESHEPAVEPGQPAAPEHATGQADFGANEWLVEELYQRYLADPGSVDRAWWSFFADYRPTRGNGTGPQPTMRESGSAETLVAPPPAPSPSAPGAAPSAPTVSQPTSQPQPVSQPQAPAAPLPQDAELTRLRGAAARTAQNMAASLAVPTATSVRAVPAKLLIDNRIVINNHLQRGKGGKVSFTHLIGYAIVKALKTNPEMNAAYAEEDGKPVL